LRHLLSPDKIKSVDFEARLALIQSPQTTVRYCSIHGCYDNHLAEGLFHVSHFRYYKSKTLIRFKLPGMNMEEG
jgi:hypothetical protein